MCSKCLLSVLPQNLSIGAVNDWFNSTATEGLEQQLGEDVDPVQELSDIRQVHPSSVFLIHLNINSLQNKFEELRLINNKLKTSILVLTETKIDPSYPDTQFKLPGY